MQAAGHTIASYCKAETTIKHIDKQTKNERSELYDCTKTLKELIKTSMIDNSIESIEIQIDGKPQYIRFNVPQPNKRLTIDDVMNASKNLSEAFDSACYIPDAIIKIMTERFKEIKEKDVKAEKKQLVICKHKGKEEKPIVLQDVPNETTKLVSDYVQVNKKLGDIRKKLRESKKEHCEVKKRMNEDVFEALKHVKGMTQQVQIVDPRSGLRQSMVLKANLDKRQQPLGIRTITPFIREAAIRSLQKMGSLTREEFEEEFRDELMTLIEERPFKEKKHIKFSKKSSVE